MTNSVRKFKMENLPLAIKLAQEQGVDVVRENNVVWFVDPNKFYMRVLSKRYRGKGRPRISDYDEN